MLTLIEYTSSYFEAWNRLVETGGNGTIFHRLDFLSYHGERFARQAHHLMWLRGDEPYAILPLGFFEENGRRVARSPVGASWGGLVHGSHFSLQDARQAVTGLMEYLRAQDVDSCSLTLPPLCYYESYSNHVEFALAEHGFQPSRREITHAVRLPHESAEVPSLLSKKCRHTARQALRNVTIEEDVSPGAFYDVLLEDKARHDAVPTHTLEELEELHRTLPGRIRIDVASNGDARAGICYFIANDRSTCVFYMAQDDAARANNFMNALVLHGMKHFSRRGFGWFDFGCSTYRMEVYDGVVRFKESFGADGLFRDTYTRDIS